jgi:hypothetical protein
MLIQRDVKLFTAKLDWLRKLLHDHGCAALSEQALAALFLEASRFYENKRQRERTARAAQHWEDLRKREAAK